MTRRQNTAIQSRIALGAVLADETLSRIETSVRKWVSRICSHQSWCVEEAGMRLTTQSSRYQGPPQPRRDSECKSAATSCL